MKNICLIGAGNIGSRHLQALKKVSIPLNIYVVDPSASSLRTTRARFDEILQTSKSHKVHYQNQLAALPKNIAIAIVATNADVRAKVIESLLAVSKVQYFILEKVLFQKPGDYTKIERLLKRHHCKAWVNCTRRQIPFYLQLKDQIKNSQIHYVVTGGNWGLASNTIHYIDYLAFLTNCYDYKINTSLLDPKPVASKRKNYLELHGHLQIHFKNGCTASIASYSENDTPCLLSIYSPDAVYIINETDLKVLSATSSNNWAWRNCSFTSTYQSELTNMTVEDILSKGSCKLTTYSKSSKLHQIFIKGILKYLKNNYNSKIDYCPIT